MRKMLLATSALGLSLATLCAPAPARADGFAPSLVMRLSGQMSQVDRLNRGRARDAVYAAIAHQIDMINDRFADVQSRRMAPRQALSMIDDSLYAILQYNQNAGYEAVWANAQIGRLVAAMRADIAALQGGAWERGRDFDRGYGRDDRGYGRGYGRDYGRGYGRDFDRGYGQTGYTPPPAPASRYYVPPPAPAPAYVPAPPAYRQEPCDDPAVRPIRY